MNALLRTGFVAAFVLAAPGLAAASSNAKSGEEINVIRLDATPLDEPKRFLGWQCRTLLRDDFSRHSRGSCSERGDGARELQPRSPESARN